MALCMRPGCDHQLTGRQRKWCSEACRKAGERARKSSGLRLAASALRPGYVGDGAFMTVVIGAKAAYPFVESDTALMMGIYKTLQNREIARHIEDILHRELPGFAFKVSFLPGKR